MNKKDREIVVKNGLLYYKGEAKSIDLPEADRLARARGFSYAEQLVRCLEKEKNKMRGDND